jgi:hypothetical protein
MPIARINFFAAFTVLSDVSHSKRRLLWAQGMNTSTAPTLKSRVSMSAVIALLAVCPPFMPDTARAYSPVPARAESRSLAAGLWGGEHVRMEVSRGGARLEYDCAASMIDQPIILDAAGRFTAKGFYTPERGGPQGNAQAAAVRAQYVGRVRADVMRLMVTLENAKEPVGVFTLRRGYDPLLTKCR